MCHLDCKLTLFCCPPTSQRFGGSSSPFYYHAMGYPAVAEPGGINGCANGKLYKHNNSVSVFSSPDLSSGSWKMESVVYPSKTSGTVRVVQCPHDCSSQAAVLVGVHVLAISVSLHHTNQERSSCRWRGSSEPNSLRLSNFTSAQCTYTTEK